MKKLVASYLIGVLAIAASLGVAKASSHLLATFTQVELNTNWQADRQLPSDGVTSVTAFGRDNVARLGINSSLTRPGIFQRTEGIKTVGVHNFGTEVQVDLYMDPDWQDKAVRAGFWVVGDNGSGARDLMFGIIEFVNNENCEEPSCTNPTNITDHEGFRIYDPTYGWSENLTTEFEYGKWVTLGIRLDTEAEQYVYLINGEEVGTAPGGSNFIREVFLNSYNYGLDNFPTLNEDSYAAHWHVGLMVPTSMDECKKGGWESFTDVTFKNQGDCVSYVQSNVHVNKR